MSWLIVRTAARKEAAVAEAIRGLGFRAWVPTRMIASRPGASRRKTAAAAVAIKELPVLPKIVFVEMDILDAHALLDICHCRAIIRDSEERFAIVSSAEVSRYKEALDRLNTAELALVPVKGQKNKAAWRQFHDALADRINAAKKQLGASS